MTSAGRVLHRAMSFRAQREIPMMSLLLAPSPKPNIAPYCHCERSNLLLSCAEIEALRRFASVHSKETRICHAERSEASRSLTLIVLPAMNEILRRSAPQNDDSQEPVMQSPFGFAPHSLRSGTSQAKRRGAISFRQHIRAPNWGSYSFLVMLLRMHEVRARRDSYTSSPGLNPLSGRSSSWQWPSSDSADL